MQVLVRLFLGKSSLWAMFLLAFFISFAFQGSRGLFDRDETRYAECAREMLVTGDFLIPKRDFRPHLTKPPFTYWAISAGMALMGKNEWGVRSGYSLSFALTVVFVTLLGSTLWDRQCGFLAGLLYMTTIVPFAASNLVTTDTFLVLWETGAVYAFVRGYRANEPENARRWFHLMWLFWGLGFITKGPAIFPVAAGIVLFWLLHIKHFKAFPLTVPGIFAFLFTGLSWYLLMYFKDPSILPFIIEEQVTGRLVSNVYHRNSAWYAPFYLYLPLLTLGALPWSALWIGFIRDLIKARSASLIPKDHRMRLVFFWFLVPLIVFCIARSRLPLYILPLFAPMAIATSYAWVKRGMDVKRSVAFFCAWVFILLSIKVGAVIYPAPQDQRATYEWIRPYLREGRLLLAASDRFMDGLAFYTERDIKYLPEKPRPKTDGKDIFEGTWDEELKLFRQDKKARVIVYKKKKEKDIIDYLEQNKIEYRLIEPHYKLGALMLNE